MIRSPIRSLGFAVFALALFVGFIPDAGATTITYNAVNVSGTTWQYDYAVTNDGTLTGVIELFDIDFDPALYDESSFAIMTPGPPAADWSEMILASGLLVPAQYDVLALGGGIGNGQTVSGFSVQFLWLGIDVPGAQAFSIYDPTTFDLLETGTTQVVPIPATLPLILTGFGVLSAFVWRRHRR